jgi:hypothetical protein
VTPLATYETTPMPCICVCAHTPTPPPSLNH